MLCITLVSRDTWKSFAIGSSSITEYTGNKETELSLILFLYPDMEINYYWILRQILQL